MITSNIKQRIIGRGRGAIFAPSDFLDIGSRASVDQALSRLTNQGVIRRLMRGLYDYPKKSPRFGFLSPSADDIAKAVARKDGQILQPSPSMAANQLGLSTQVPSKPTYMTDGPTRTKKVGRQVIQFRNASSKTLVAQAIIPGLSSRHCVMSARTVWTVKSSTGLHAHWTTMIGSSWQSKAGTSLHGCTPSCNRS